jgi:hypothetical protein
MFEPVKYPEVTTFTTLKRKTAENAPLIHAKNMYYYSDGTGRDSYIV